MKKNATTIPKDNPYLQLVGSFTSSFFDKYRQKYLRRQVIYFDKDGKKTSDVSQAMLTPFGKPVVAGLSDKPVLPVEPKNHHITFNPRDPLARQRAFSARASFMEMSSYGNDYRDKFDNLNYANNVANKVVEIVTIQNNNSKIPNDENK